MREIFAILLLPILIIPITLYVAGSFGHTATNFLVGGCFLAGFMIFAKTNEERKLMLVLAIVASLFETSNVAIGAYTYANTIQVPLWVSLGWGVLGIYVVKNLKILNAIPTRVAYFFAVGLYFIAWFHAGMKLEGLFPPIAGILGVYVFSKSTEIQPGFFFYTGLMGMLIEFSGTSAGVWTYFSSPGVPMLVPLAALGTAYTSVIAFCMWLSKIELKQTI